MHKYHLIANQTMYHRQTGDRWIVLFIDEDGEYMVQRIGEPGSRQFMTPKEIRSTFNWGSYT